MKYLILGLLLTGCGEANKTPETQAQDFKVNTRIFKDGNVTCYEYVSHGISCVRNDK